MAGEAVRRRRRVCGGRRLRTNNPVLVGAEPGATRTTAWLGGMAGSGVSDTGRQRVRTTRRNLRAGRRRVGAMRQRACAVRCKVHVASRRAHGEREVRGAAHLHITQPKLVS